MQLTQGDGKVVASQRLSSLAPACETLDCLNPSIVIEGTEAEAAVFSHRKLSVLSDFRFKYEVQDQPAKPTMAASVAHVRVSTGTVEVPSTQTTYAARAV